MADASNELLQQVAAGVLEESAFLLLNRVDSPEFGERVLISEVSYSGPGAGRVRLVATAELDAEAASNMLGSDPDDPDGIADPGTALSELSNIVTGVLVAELYGRQAVCHLGIPKVHEGPPPPWPGEADCFVAFSDDEGRFITIELAKLAGEPADGAGT